MWIARDKNNLLCLYFNYKPQKNKVKLKWDNNIIPIVIDSTLFPEVKWEDDEPTEVELVIKK